MHRELTTKSTQLLRINYLLAHQKIHLNCDLTIDDFAQAIGVHPRKLSTVLKSYFSCTYAQLITKYRIDEAKQLLGEADNIAVADIALKSGFNNLASFHRSFKQVTGQTPTEFHHSQMLINAH